MQNCHFIITPFPTDARRGLRRALGGPGPQITGYSYSRKLERTTRPNYTSWFKELQCAPTLEDEALLPKQDRLITLVHKQFPRT